MVNAFQFYDSPIKRERRSVQSQSKIRFNSMIVRLKDYFSDSMDWLYIKFQFYDSPIKSTLSSRLYKIIEKFQFYDSPIKSTFKGYSLCLSN